MHLFSHGPHADRSPLAVWLTPGLVAGCLGLGLTGLGGVKTLPSLLCLPPAVATSADGNKTLKSSLVNQCCIIN